MELKWKLPTGKAVAGEADVTDLHEKVRKADHPDLMIGHDFFRNIFKLFSFYAGSYLHMAIPKIPVPKEKPA